jgi:hypothetical protein
LAGLNSQEDDEAAEIELTYSILDNINQARPAFGRPAVCIIQDEGSGGGSLGAKNEGVEEFGGEKCRG